MTRRFNIAALKAISQAPASGEAGWLIAAEDSVAFLKENAQSEDVVIYAIGPATLIHAVLAPLKQVTPADQKDLMCWIPCDHVPARSWPLFKARDVLRGVIESLRQEAVA